MEHEDFWNRIKHACVKLGIPLGTFQVWKHRGSVPGNKAIQIFMALKGTKNSVSLEQLSNE